MKKDKEPSATDKKEWVLNKSKYGSSEYDPSLLTIDTLLMINKDTPKMTKKIGFKIPLRQCEIHFYTNPNSLLFLFYINMYS